MESVQISRNELFDNYLPSFQLNEYGVKSNDPNYPLIAAAWDKLCDEMDQISGWYLSRTNDRVNLPMWSFGLTDGDPFITVTMTTFGALAYNIFIGLEDKWYCAGAVEDVAPLIYAFRLFV